MRSHPSPDISSKRIPFAAPSSGRYQEVLSLNGAISTLLVSLIVFVVVWWSTRVILERWQREDWGRVGSMDRSLSDGPLLIPVVIEPLASAANK